MINYVLRVRLAQLSGYFAIYKRPKLLKRAAAKIHDGLKRTDLNVKVIMQIHDEPFFKIAEKT